MFVEIGLSLKGLTQSQQKSIYFLFPWACVCNHTMHAHTIGKFAPGTPVSLGTRCLEHSVTVHSVSQALDLQALGLRAHRLRAHRLRAHGLRAHGVRAHGLRALSLPGTQSPRHLVSPGTQSTGHSIF